MNKLAAGVSMNSSGRKLWRSLTDSERKILGGDYSAAFKKAGTVGMWMRLRGLSAEAAVVELAGMLLGTLPGELDWLRDEFALREAFPSTSSPVWIRDLGELRYEGRVCRKIRSVNASMNIVAILDAFQEAGWPPRIDSPPGLIRPDQSRYYYAIRVLNRGLTRLRFRADGRTEGIVWELIDAGARST